MINSIVLVGRVSFDPELQYTPSGIAVTKFSVAVQRPQGKDARERGDNPEADFIPCVAWRQAAEFVANYLRKGALVSVEGRLQIREYVTGEGEKKKAAEVMCEQVRALEGKQQREEREARGSQ
jgi:single-strand DNA-binding protein